MTAWEGRNACLDIESAPVVSWCAGEEGFQQDRWSKTYIQQEKTVGNTTITPIQPSDTGLGNSSRRFPRPSQSANVVCSPMSSRVSAHIASTTASRPASPLKASHTGFSSQSDEAKAKEGILPGPRGFELAKVWGSVLQPKETLDSFNCALCSTPFPPDATIYPDPSHVNASGVDTSSSQDGIRFLCKPCFTANGGSRGNCHNCHRPVLILKSEGGFVENSGRVWHKKCFECDGCGKNIGDQPMVDLLGRPSCAECFDTCLKRPSRDDVFGSPRRNGDTVTSNLGGNRKERAFEREDSPALEELETRLGIHRNLQSTSSSTSSPVGRLARTPVSTPTKEPSKEWQTAARSERSRAESLSSPSISSPLASSTRCEHLICENHVNINAERSAVSDIIRPTLRIAPLAVLALPHQAGPHIGGKLHRTKLMTASAAVPGGQRAHARASAVKESGQRRRQSKK